MLFGFFNSPKKWTKNFCPSSLGQKLIFSSSFFGRIEDTKIYFRNWLTFMIKKTFWYFPTFINEVKGKFSFFNFDRSRGILFNFDRLILLPCNKMGFGFESWGIAISRKLIENFNAITWSTYWFSVRFEKSIW